MDAERNDAPPARGTPRGPVIWDRASWHDAPLNGERPSTSAEHITAILRWLWAHGLTTEAGDLAARGSFSGSLGAEPALSSELVVERAAVFLDHFYGRWLSLLSELGDAADDASIDILWDEFERDGAGLDRVWEIG